MKKSRFTETVRVWMMLSFTAVLADLFYIIWRAGQPVVDIESASFLWAVPEMLELMLLSVAVIAGFMAVSARIIKEGENI